MKTKCHCCNSKRIIVCTQEDAHKFDEGTVVEHCYECLDCDYSGCLEVEDW